MQTLYLPKYIISIIAFIIARFSAAPVYSSLKIFMFVYSRRRAPGTHWISTA